MRGGARLPKCVQQVFLFTAGIARQPSLVPRLGRLTESEAQSETLAGQPGLPPAGSIEQAHDFLSDSAVLPLPPLLSLGTTGSVELNYDMVHILC